MAGPHAAVPGEAGPEPTVAGSAREAPRWPGWDALEGPLDPKWANVLYHDAAARSYDGKWAISFDRRCMSYVGDRARRMLPSPRYRRVLDVGCGTGFFILNLWQAGFVGEAHACDLSPGMLAACAETACRIGCDVSLRTADAEALPYPDSSFDLVVGHAFLHHVPLPEAALRELYRVLVPGGDLLVAGEPTRVGDRLARATGRLTWRGLQRAGRLVPALRPPGPARRPAPEDEPACAEPSEMDEDGRVLRDLEWSVDLHTFDPSVLEDMARAAGFQSVRVETEELLSSLVGWAVRTVEASVRPGLLGRGWATLAYRTYQALSTVDDRVLARLLPRELFYNALLYGAKEA